jgi:hypothetical protein
MKFIALSVSLMAGLVAASPTPTTDQAANYVAIAKRASVSDVSPIARIFKRILLI